MKMLIKMSALIFIAGLSLWAQIPPDVFISSSSGSILCEFYFFNPIKINNDYLYVSKLSPRNNLDSINSDNLTFAMSIENKIFIRSISFSKNGHIYCSTDSFPTRDSINFKGGSRDSLFFHDSVLGFKINKSARQGQFTWRLNQKYLFCKGDTIKLLLDEPAQRIPPQQIQPNMKTPAKPTNLHHGNKFMLMEKESSPFSMREQQSFPLFDLRGKKQRSLSSGSALFIIRP